ncbi:hypothetical protein [Maribacter halichondriae]|uniref:hypothetical protein n=1 Tax=Maribacter halichondriae TaxID=2980554 RepID=UPI00235827F4|nr:hypothetical protein [Maribacter sp. Hal144]
MNRKTFIKKTAGAMLVALPVASFIACSSSDDGTATPMLPEEDPQAEADCGANGTNSSIGGNHGHTLVVSKADVAAGAEKTYSIQGSSGHDHTVTLTAANFTTLMNNSAISVVSSNDDSHTHSISVSCA